MKNCTFYLPIRISGIDRRLKISRILFRPQGDVSEHGEDVVICNTLALLSYWLPKDPWADIGRSREVAEGGQYWIVRSNVLSNFQTFVEGHRSFLPHHGQRRCEEHCTVTNLDNDIFIVLFLLGELRLAQSNRWLSFERQQRLELLIQVANAMLVVDAVGIHAASVPT